MSRSLPWLLSGLLIAGAIVVAFLGTGMRSPDRADESSAPGVTPSAGRAAEADQTESGSMQLASRTEQPQGLGARLLSDSDNSRQNLLGMTIREAGYDCPEVRSAEALEGSGQAWRAYCGDLRLYWIEIDEFGRMSVEPGDYNESGFDTGGSGGGRTLTIQPEDLNQLQDVR